MQRHEGRWKTNGKQGKGQTAGIGDFSGKCCRFHKVGHQAAACPEKQDLSDEVGKTKSCNQIHEVAAEKGDCEMGTVDLCPFRAITDDLYEWYDRNPWQGALAPYRGGLCVTAQETAI